jgi:hypothetical protein
LLTRRILVPVLAVVACAVPASATISYYVDLPTFTAATTDLSAPQTVDFTSLSGTFFDSTTVNTIQFTGAGPDHNAGGELTVQSSPGGSWPAGMVLAHSAGTGLFNSGGTITITFPSTVVAFAFYTSYLNTQDSLDIVVTDGTPGDTLHQTPFPAQTSPYFLGIRADQPITGVTLTASSMINEQIAIGGFIFDTAGSGSSTPETGTFLLMGTGLALLPLVRRRFGGRKN